MRKLAAASFSRACSAALLALVLFLDVTHAGRAYVYCTSMQEVMQHACCQQHRALTSTPTVSASGTDCCQNEAVPSLGSWTPVSRPLFVAAPLLAVVARWPVELLAADLTRVGMDNPLIRSGPPLLRVLAQLMVFRL